MHGDFVAMNTRQHVKSGRHVFVINATRQRAGPIPVGAGEVGDLFTGFDIALGAFGDTQLVDGIVSEATTGAYGAGSGTGITGAVADITAALEPGRR